MNELMVRTELNVDTSGFQRALANVNKTVEEFDKKINDMPKRIEVLGAKLSGLGAKMQEGLTQPIKDAKEKMITAATELEDNLNRVNATFGNSANTVNAWADTATKQFGLSKSQALETASAFGDMASAVGMGQPEAAGMSTSLAGLAGDLAALKNVGIEEAMSALSGVFTGETQGLAQMGIAMSETDLANFAAQTGQVYSQMSEAEKAQLRYNYVMGQTQSIQGSYAGASDSAANSIQTFQAATSNLMAVLGEKLLPTFTPLIQKATDLVTAFVNADPSLQNFAVKGMAVVGAMGPLISTLGGAFQKAQVVTGAFGKVSSKISEMGGKTSLITGLKTVFAALTSPVGLAVAAVTALVGVFAYLMATNEGLRNSVMGTISVLIASLQPVILMLITSLGQLIANIGPLIAQLVTQLAPIIATIITTVAQMIASILPALISIITVIISTISGMLPTITNILSVAISVIQGIISAISPIAGFIAGVIASIISYIAPVGSTFFNVFSGIFTTVSNVMNRVGQVIANILGSIRSAWSGLTSFVSGIFDGIAGAVSSLVDQVKGFVNGVIGGINAAIKLINKIPGVEIGTIPYLAHGTDRWAGGFAVINEGGRGELTYLPNGSQVIPHDISVKYAKEAAKNNTQTSYISADALGEYIVSAMIEYGNRQKEGIEKGIGKMGIYIGNRQAGRAIANMGFIRR